MSQGTSSLCANKRSRMDCRSPATNASNEAHSKCGIERKNSCSWSVISRAASIGDTSEKVRRSFLASGFAGAGRRRGESAAGGALCFSCGRAGTRICFSSGERLLSMAWKAGTHEASETSNMLFCSACLMNRTALSDVSDSRNSKCRIPQLNDASVLRARSDVKLSPQCTTEEHDKVC